MRLHRHLFASLLLIATAAFAADTAATRTATDGVYTAEQVARGKKAYNSLCARCHGETLGGGEDSPALVGKEFLKNWTAKSIGELVEYTRTEMPSDGPGKVTRKQSTDLAAFMLGANGYPTGAEELEPNVELLNQIQITPKK